MKHCLYCDKPIVRRPNERNDGFVIRVYCDRFCAAKRNAVIRKHTRGNFYGKSA